MIEACKFEIKVKLLKYYDYFVRTGRNFFRSDLCINTIFNFDFLQLLTIELSILDVHVENSSLSVDSLEIVELSRFFNAIILIFCFVSNIFSSTQSSSLLAIFFLNLI